jgi:RHH-type rel operon transcriptional repressor/antitoxin RelB
MYSVEVIMPTSVRLAPELEKRLSHLASVTGRTKAYYIKEAVTSTIDRMEYEYGILKDLEDYRAGRVQALTSKEVGEQLGLDG